MDGIGNDIIALKTIDIARTRNPRFYKKILADTELQLYQEQHSHLPLERFVWLLWSVKESAYKCLQRLQPHLVFSPVGTVVTRLVAPAENPSPLTATLVSTGFNDAYCFRSVISFQTQTLYARSVIYGDELIHTVASFNADFGGINWGLERIAQTDPESQSAGVRKFLLDNYHTKVPGKSYHVEKSASGYPFISVEGMDTGAKVSLSHHDEWVGYAFIC